MKMRVCIIGAGVSGLCSIKWALEYGCDVIAFEQSTNIGGTWVFCDEIGTNEYGLSVHSSMFKGLQTDIPKEVMCYPDLPYPIHEISYITSENVLSYLGAYASKFGLFEKIQFRHSVVRVLPLDSAYTNSRNNEWEIVVRDLVRDTYETHLFDAVLVCTGNFHTPHRAAFNGNDLFNGIQMHSHDYRDAELFRDESVLIIGSGPSGIDLVQEIAKTAKNVAWSTRAQKKLNIKLPSNVVEKPDVSELTPDGAIFTDESDDKFSIILHCTGHSHSFPFLSVDCGVAVEENFVAPLYKHCLSINRPTLGFIGLPTVVCNNQVFDFQARFCLKFMTEQLKLPEREEMLRDFQHDMNGRWKRGLTKRRAHMMGFDVQEKYFEELANTAQLEPVKPVILNIFNKSIINLFTNLNNFREKKFKVVSDVEFEES